jgi:hypothetical protein
MNDIFINLQPQGAFNFHFKLYYLLGAVHIRLGSWLDCTYLFCFCIVLDVLQPFYKFFFENLSTIQFSLCYLLIYRSPMFARINLNVWLLL